MTSMGKPRQESALGAQGQEVLWLAQAEPPAQLVTFLKSRGLALVPAADATTSSPLKLLQVEPAGPALARTPQLNGRRVAVMHPDPGNADALAQSLRAKGAEVVALSLNPGSLQRAETLDPEVVIMEVSDFSGSCWEIVRALWQHQYLRFATFILATPELMGSAHMTALDVQTLSIAITEVAKSYERVREDAQKSERFSFELHDLGPSRSLRALLESGRSLRALFTCDDSTIEIDFAEQIIVGAQSPAGAAPNEGLLGVHALNLLLSQRAAHVSVRRVDHPTHTNVMAPLDTALHMARDLAAAVRPSGTHAPITAERTQTAKPSKLASRNRTLIGVPAVQVDPALLGGKTKPGAAVAPAEPKQEPKLEAKPPPPPRPSIPARAAPPSIAAPGPTKRSLPPRRKSDEAVEAIAAPPAAPRALSVPPALPSTRPPAQALERPPAPPPSIEIAPDVVIEPVGPAPTPEPLRALSPQSALETLKLPIYTPNASAESDAEVVRSFRRGPSIKLSGSARWIAGGACAALLGGWLFMRAAPVKPAPEPMIAPAASELVPVARAAEPTATAPALSPPVAPEPMVAAPTAKASQDDEQLPSAKDGRQTRESARRAGILCNQGNDFKNKKMLPTARVRYIEALRVYPDYPRALAGLTQLALIAGDSGEALKFGKQLIKARPGQAAYHLLLGDAYHAARDEKAARDAYQTALRMGNRTAKERLGK